MVTRVVIAERHVAEAAHLILQQTLILEKLVRERNETGAALARAVYVALERSLDLARARQRFEREVVSLKKRKRRVTRAPPSAHETS